MRIYKILAIINIVLVTISYITGRVCKNSLSACLGTLGFINGLSNIFLCLMFPLEIILFILNV